MLNSNNSSRLRPGRPNEKEEEIKTSDGRIAEN